VPARCFLGCRWRHRFNARNHHRLFRVSSFGGQPVPVTTTDPGLDSHRWPFFLPDGKHFLYYALGIMTLACSRQPLRWLHRRRAGKFLQFTHANAAYANGHLLFVKDNALTAQRSM